MWRTWLLSTCFLSLQNGTMATSLDGSEHSKTSQVKSKSTLPKRYILHEQWLWRTALQRHDFCKDCHPTKVPQTSVVQTRSQTASLTENPSKCTTSGHPVALGRWSVCLLFCVRITECLALTNAEWALLKSAAIQKLELCYAIAIFGPAWLLSYHFNSKGTNFLQFSN